MAVYPYLVDRVVSRTRKIVLVCSAVREEIRYAED